MGIANIINVTGSAGGGEIIRELSSSSDGQGLHFDGAGQVTSTASSMPVPYSMELIFTPDDVTTAQTLFGNSYSGTQRRALAIKDGKFILTYYEGGSWTNVTGGSLEVGKTYHAVGTRDASGTQKIYINGNDVTTGTTPDGYMQSSLRALGSASGGTYFTGNIYRARIYNKALTQAEVDSAYQRADVDFADQYGSQTSKILNGVAWTGASGTTQPTSWTIGSQGTYTIDSSSGSGAEPALKIARNSDNPYIYQTFTAVVGKKYRVKYRVKNIDATHVKVGIGSTAIGTQYNSTNHTSTSWADFDETYTATTTTFSVYVQVATSTGTQAGYIDSFVVEQVGCVSDYDLAFANPTQSLMVQDRAGAADGTSSASGVEQTQKIVQLNSTSARIGTSAATPADGTLLTRKLQVGGAGEETHPQVQIVPGTSSGDSMIQFRNTANDGTIAQIKAMQTSGTVDGLAIGTAESEHLKIDSTGNVQIGSGALAAVGGGPTLGICGAAPEITLRDSATNTPYAVMRTNDSGNLYLEADKGDNAGASKVILGSDGADILSFKKETAYVTRGTQEQSAAIAHNTTTTFEAPSNIFMIYDTAGYGATFFNDYSEATVTKIAGATHFTAGGSGAIRLTTAANDSTVTVDNQQGGTRTIKILNLGN